MSRRKPGDVIVSNEGKPLGTYPCLYAEVGTTDDCLKGRPLPMYEHNFPVVVLETAPKTYRYNVTSTSWQKTKILTAQGEVGWVWVLVP